MEYRVLSCGGASRHAKTRKSRHLAKKRQIVIFHHFAGFRVAPFRVFAWRGEMSPCENPLNGDHSIVY